MKYLYRVKLFPHGRKQFQLYISINIQYPLFSSGPICRFNTCHVDGPKFLTWSHYPLIHIVATFWAVGIIFSLPDFDLSWSLLLPHKTKYKPTNMIIAPIILKIVQLTE